MAGAPPPSATSSMDLHIAAEMGKRAGNEHSAGGLTGNECLGQNVGSDLCMNSLKPSLFGGLSESSISMPLGDGVFNKNPISQVADGTLIGGPNVNATADLSRGIQGVGDMSLQNAAGLPSGTNLPDHLSGIHNPGRGGGHAPIIMG